MPALDNAQRQALHRTRAIGKKAADAKQVFPGLRDPEADGFFSPEQFAMRDAFCTALWDRHARYPWNDLRPKGAAAADSKENAPKKSARF